MTAVAHNRMPDTPPAPEPRADGRFAFGKNWADFMTSFSGQRLASARQGVLECLTPEDIRGRRVLDAGSGSGLMSLVFVELGAGEVVAVDYDADSVATTAQVLSTHAAGKNWHCRRDDILTMTPETAGTFDLVYSWGVLHHTGDMHRALKHAAGLVREGGKFMVALYGRTPLCRFWAWEKKIYHTGNRLFCGSVRALYKTACVAGLVLTGRNPVTYMRQYHRQRGMSWHHDVEDWLGGYPYESIAPAVLEQIMAGLGFSLQRKKVRRRLGLLGSGCDEYLFVKKTV